MRPTIQALVLWAVCVVWMRFHKTAALQAKVKCSNWGKTIPSIVYIDGVPVAARDSWEGTIPDDTSLIAVRCYSSYSYSGYYGLIVSVSNGFVTDSFWRCSPTASEGWFSTDYNDTAWNTSHIIPNFPSDPSFPPSAKWIWARDKNGWSSSREVVCRGRLRIQYHVECSGPATVYIDGRKERDTTTAPTAWNSITRRTTRVIAIKCKSTKKSRDIEFLFSSYFGAGNWKCTDKTIGNEWYNVDFNDTSWEKNMKYEKTSDDPSPQSMNTWRISTTGTKLFCRGQLECGCDQICTPANNGYDFKCSCRKGFNLLNDKRSCEDIDECQLNNGNCNFVCYNTNGSYYCGCELGYVLSLDGSLCEDENECDTRNNGCEQHCNNTIGSYSCSCRPGFRLDDDGLSCLDLDKCNSTDHGCEHGCINSEGSYKCRSADSSGGADKSSQPAIGAVLGGVVFLIVVTSLVVACVCFVKRQRTRHQDNHSKEPRPRTTKPFTTMYAEMQVANTEGAMTFRKKPLEIGTWMSISTETTFLGQVISTTSMNFLLRLLMCRQKGIIAMSQ